MGFFNIHSAAKRQKIEGGPFGENFFFEKKSNTAEKTERGPFSLYRYGMLRGKRGKTFWFSSLDQMIQFGTIKFCRTFKNYFGQFLWIEKKREKQAATGPSRRHIQGSKIAKRLPSVNLQYSKIEKPKKMDRVARPCAKEKKFLEKTFHNAEKQLEGGTLWDFSTSILSQLAKKLKGDPLGKKFSKKSLAVPKKMKGGTLWSRPVWYVTRENRKNLFGSVR